MLLKTFQELQSPCFSTHVSFTSFSFCSASSLSLSVLRAMATSCFRPAAWQPCPIPVTCRRGRMSGLKVLFVSCLLSQMKLNSNLHVGFCQTNCIKMRRNWFLRDISEGQGTKRVEACFYYRNFSQDPGTF